MKKEIFSLLFLVVFILASCSKEANDPIPDPDPDPVITYTSEHPSNLNVVYFIPTDKSPLKNYQKRISGIMLHTQEWFKNEMNRNGYGDKTFGLLVDDKNANSIKITIINGQSNSDAYPYNGGGSKAGAEIATYFNNNPAESASDHTVVFMPSRTGDNGWDAGGVPFYGIGRWCYVLDYLNFDMNTWRNGTRQGETNWIGGTIHEIGHALNLPHNQHKVSDGWISMMSWGNHEYNKTPDEVHLTKASAAILNNNQVFNKKDKSQFYNNDPSHSIKSLRIYADATNLYVKSKFDATEPVNAVNIYNDPKTSSSDSNYNAISWSTSTIIDNDSISVVMPLSEFNQDYKQYLFDLRIRFCHTNGQFSFENFQYNFVNDKPDIDVNVKEVAEVDKSAWTIVDVSSDESVADPNNGHAKHAIDGNGETFWHSAWRNSQPDYPHSITFNLNKDQVINGFTFLQRRNKSNGRIKTFTIEVSTDGTTFESAGDYTLENNTSKQLIELSSAKTARYFRLKINSGHDNGSGENVFFTFLAEVGIY